MLFMGLPRDTVEMPEWGLRKIHEGQLGRSLCGPPPPPWSSLEHQGRAPPLGEGVREALGSEVGAVVHTTPAISLWALCYIIDKESAFLYKPVFSCC